MFSDGGYQIAAQFVLWFSIKTMSEESENVERAEGEIPKTEKMFTLKKWNAVAMWSWDVECDTCAICRVQVMGKCFRLGVRI